MEFETPIVIPLGIESSAIELKSAEDVFSFLKGQIARWGDAVEALGYSGLGDHELRVILGRQQTNWSDLLRFFGSRGRTVREDMEQKLLAGISANQYLVADEPIVRRALALIPEDLTLARFLLRIANGELRLEADQWKDSPGMLYEYLRAVACLTSTADQAAMVEKCKAAVEYADEFARSSKARHEKILAQIRESQLHFEQEVLAVKEDAEKRLRSIDTEWGHLRVVYDTSLKLEAPRRYWDGKQQAHAASAARWRKAFVLSAFVGLFVILMSVLVLPWLAKAGVESFGPFAWVIPASLLGVPVFLTLWVLRICGRQWSDHLIRLEDARERVAMVETFLALSRNEDSPNTIADAAHLTIVLGALFRAGPGLSQDDAPPVSILELAMSRFGGSKSA